LRERAAVDLENRQQALRVQREELRLPLLTAAARKMPRQGLVRQALQIKCDAYAIRGRASIVGMQLHRR
jgi:hypothetical protein